ncbi:MAG: PDZ domain-containing protein, partial [Planctomycetota bacterium]|nr:PDZ domain-containing protein [Planctomycetota bacterium]
MNKSAVLVLSLLTLVAAAPAQDAAKTDAPAAKAKKPDPNQAWLDKLQWRSIGPANMGGRITALAVHPTDRSTWWAATAAGGLLKTINNGITFVHQFDKEATVSIGDFAVAPSNPNVLYIGTGEANPRNSVSWGDGVYKSTDGGKTWKNVGLKKSFQVGQIAIHPKDENVVYVGAMGRCWGPNEERGLFKTTDGGKTWKKILYINERTGVIDVQMNPKDPNTLLVATWERQRDGFDTNHPALKWGPGSALWKTTDGGKSFKKLSKGLPSCQIGRIGLDYFKGDPNVVLMVLESERIGKEPPNSPYMGITGTNAEVGAKLTTIVKDGPSEKAGLKVNDIVLKVGATPVHSYNDMLRAVRQHVAGDTVKLEISRARKPLTIELKLASRPKPKPQPNAAGGTGAAAPRRGPRGRAARSPFAAMLNGQRANMHDQQGNEGHEYGGVYKSEDGGETWKRINSVNPRPMYFSEIRVDPNDAKNLWVLGVRLWRSKDGGATFTPDGGRGVHPDHHALWIDPTDSRHMINGNDGGIYVSYDKCANWDHLNHVAIGQFYHVGIGPRRDYRVYGGLQDNGSWGGPSRVRHGSGPTNTDWARIGGGDGFLCRVDPNDPDRIYFESQNGAIGRRHLRTAERVGFRPRGTRETRYRFNWRTPFILSTHNTKIYYTTGNRVFRSLDRGNGLKAISPDITATERGSGTALAESHFDANVLYVGSDDGGLFMTKDGGYNWINLFGEDPKPETKKKDAPGAIVRTKKETKADPVKADPTKADPVKAGKNDPEAKPANGDDAKPKADPAAARRAERIRTMMARFDENGDGALQVDEWPQGAAGPLARFDTNKDKVIDLKEMTAGMATMQGRRGGRRGARGARRGGAARADGANADAKAEKAPDDGSKPIRHWLPERRWVNHLEASRYKAGRAYVVFDGHRSDDDRPHVYATENYGQTWRPLHGKLPASAGTTRVLKEDLQNENLLYLGTEFGAWASLDRGATWMSLNTNLPTVAVHGFALHPTVPEIVAATHGRSLWVLDVTALRQMSKEVMDKDVHLFAPASAVIWRPDLGRGSARSFRGRNANSGIALYYALKTKQADLAMRVMDATGEVIRDL